MAAVFCEYKDLMWHSPYVHADLGFFLNGRVLPNSSSVLFSEIGEGSSALYCLTDRTKCCTTEAGGAFGTWRFPDGSNISASTTADVYQTGNYSSVLLNRKRGVTVPIGDYTCVVPDSGDILQILYIKVNDTGT